jgi:DNA-binding response OmpR family regulator
MPVLRPVLIVEDDAALRAALAEHLLAEGGLLPGEAGTVAEAEALLGAADARWDAVLLDLGLPDGDGRDLCARLRRAGRRMPVIMLTGLDGEADVVRGLEAGADDYLAKPFRAGELLARLRARLRVFDEGEDAVFAVGPYELRPAARLLLDRARAGRKVRLTGKEAAILKRLHRAGGRPVPRQALLDEVWGYSAAVTTHTLETHVYRLRQKIEAAPARPRLLLTESGGYRLDPAAAGEATAAAPAA